MGQGSWCRSVGGRAASVLVVSLVALLCLVLFLRLEGGSRDVRVAAKGVARRLATAVGLARTALVPTAEDEGQAGDDAAELRAVRSLLQTWPAGKPRACILVLARNSDLAGVQSSIGQLERRFNAAAGYPVIYLNDRPFTAEFRQGAAAISKAPSFFGLVPREHWSYPDHINQTLAAERRAAAEGHMPYGGSESYRFMCRYFSGFFFDHPLLAGFDFYWRVEPNVHFFCDVEDDPFRAMQQSNQSLAWTITVREVPETIPTLWPTVQQWLADNQHHIAPDNLLPAFLLGEGEMRPGPAGLVDVLMSRLGLQGKQQGEQRVGGGVERERRLVGSGRGDSQPWLHSRYTTCHFWSNFEIGRLSFFRSRAYRELFAHLDAAGGFFLERWGDAPVHTLAAAALLDRSQIRWAEDIGYGHGSWANCPREPAARKRCACNTLWDMHVNSQNYCQVDFLARLAALERRRTLEDARP